MKDKFELIMKIVAIIIGLITIYMMILKLTNHSPTVDAIIGTIIIGNTGILGSIYKFKGKTEHFMEESKEKFARIENKVDKIELDLNDLKIESKLTRRDIELIKHRLGIKA